MPERSTLTAYGQRLRTPMRIVFACGLFVLIGSIPRTASAAAPTAATAEHAVDATFSEVLIALHQTTFRKLDPGGAQRGALDLAAAVLPQVDSVPAIYQLWVQGRLDTVELWWWRKDDRLSRVFIAMLFYCAVGDEGERVADFPPFGPHRYASPERENRLAEIAFVRKHRSALAAELVDIFKDAVAITPRYERFVETARRNEGEPLPRTGVDARFRD